MRTTLALLTLVAALALGAPAAVASTATDSANGVSVTVSLSDTVALTAPFTVAETIANETTKARIVRVTQAITGPNGRVLSVSYPLFLRAGASLSFTLTFKLPAVPPPGTYSLTLSAGAASATATTVVG